MLQIPELLAPAGDLERLRYAINYGADAVYCSLPEFGMRSAPANFTPEQLAEGVIYAHARGRKVYLTMNTLPTNEEADRLPEAIKAAAAAGVDAFIVADLGVLEACKQFAPEIDVHMSTQTGITNWAAARAAYNMGAKRVVLAREMSLQDIATLTGGRAAEEVAFNSITTGASNDIEQATKLARAMLTRYGMSDEFDMVALETVNNQYLGGDTSLACSAQTQREIDQKVVELVRAQHEKAVRILTDNRAKLDELAQYLYQKETITGEEFMEILNREPAQAQ